MRVTRDYQEFMNKTGMVMGFIRVRRLGFNADTIAGSFRPDSMEEVLDFCAQSSQFHIVSYLGEGVFINRYDEKGGLFFLANGDRDPNFMLDSSISYKWLISTN